MQNIALVCNIRPADPVAGPDDEFEEFDSPVTAKAISDLLEEKGMSVSFFEADRHLPKNLATGNFDMVFNIAEGVGGRCREAHVPALCELLGIPYTGSDPLTLAATLDKSVAKRLVCGEVSTPKWKLVKRIEDLNDFRLEFPVFVKPNDEGSSKGIRETNRCECLTELKAVAAELLATYGRPLLVEEFVRGHEVTVSVLGNESPRVLGVLQVVPSNGSPIGDFIYSLDAKRNYETRVTYVTPPKLPSDWLQRVERAALSSYRLLECRDVARIDFRVAFNGEPYFIEANPLPGLNPTSGDLVITAKGNGMEWKDLILQILDVAEKRVVTGAKD